MSLSALSFSISDGFTASAKQSLPGTASAITFPSASAAPSAGTTFSLAFGTGTGNANKIVCQQRTLSAGGNESLTLSGNMTDVFGGSAGFTTIRAIYLGLVANPDGSTGAGSLSLGGGTNAWPGWFGNGTPTVESGGVPYTAGSAAGKAVTASTADQLLIVNNDGAHAGTYVLALAGE